MSKASDNYIEQLKDRCHRRNLSIKRLVDFIRSMGVNLDAEVAWSTTAPLPKIDKVAK